MGFITIQPSIWYRKICYFFRPTNSRKSKVYQLGAGFKELFFGGTFHLPKEIEEDSNLAF